MSPAEKRFVLQMKMYGITVERLGSSSINFSEPNLYKSGNKIVCYLII